MEYIETDLLVPHPLNPRKISRASLDKLKESIQENPTYFEARPIVASLQDDGSYLVLGGHQRLKASKELGLFQVPVNIMTGLTEDQEQEILLRDNLSSGKTDEKKLQALNPVIVQKVGLVKPPKIQKPKVGTTITLRLSDHQCEELESMQIDLTGQGILEALGIYDD